jgi:hypothetical protein
LPAAANVPSWATAISVFSSRIIDKFRLCLTKLYIDSIFQFRRVLCAVCERPTWRKQ